MAIYVEHDDNVENPLGYVVYADDLEEFHEFNRAHRLYMEGFYNTLIVLGIKLEV